MSVFQANDRLRADVKGRNCTSVKRYEGQECDERNAGLFTTSMPSNEDATYDPNRMTVASEDYATGSRTFPSKQGDVRFVLMPSALEDLKRQARQAC